MRLDEVSQVGNVQAMEMCRRFLEEFGPGKEYECAIGSAATTILFHVFRVALPKSKEKAVELLQVILDDVAHNVNETSKDKIKFTVA